MRRARAGRVDEPVALTLAVGARKLLAALPDGITSLVFLSAWIAPTQSHPSLVKNLVLTMLVEFLVIHANGFMMAPLAKSDATRARRAGAILAVSLLYIVFIAAFCIAFDATWPLWAFGWLIASKVVFTLTDKGAGNEQAHNAMLWAASAGFYILGVFLTATIPLPRLGITGTGASYDIAGSGLWVESPHIPIALGVLYFGALAWFKFRVVLRP